MKGSMPNIGVPNVGVEKHRSGQMQESQTSEWDKRRSGTNVGVDKRRILGQTSEWTNTGIPIFFQFLIFFIQPIPLLGPVIFLSEVRLGYRAGGRALRLGRLGGRALQP